MTVRDIITRLMSYNMDADFRIFVNNELIKDFGFSFGSTAGITESRSTDVNLEIVYGEALNIKTGTIPPEDTLPEPEPVTSNPSKGAHVGPNTSQGKGNWFAGTSWG